MTSAEFASELDPLKRHPNWVLWKYEKRDGEPTKPPFMATPPHGYASNNKPETWAPFELAYNVFTFGKGFVGVGFELLGTPYDGIDLDGVLHEGVAEEYSLEILRILGNPYTEITPSGDGLRAFVECSEKLPQGQRKFTTKNPKYGGEIYCGREPGRYFTVTGKKFCGQGIPAVTNIWLPYLLISQILSVKFKSLWLGDTSAYGGDDSKADLALLDLLAKVHGGDEKKMEMAFSSSRLGKREKWQSRADYRKRSIQKALGSHGSLGLSATPPHVEVTAPTSAPPQIAEPQSLDIADMPESVLDGRLGEICKKRLLELSPLAYAWPSLMTVAGTLANQNSTLRTNLFCGLVGPGQTGKSTTTDNALTALGLSKDSPELEKSMAGSAEGLLRKIGDANGCSRLYFPDELSHLFAKAQIDRATFAPVLQRCFYHTSFDLIIAKGQHFPFNCSLGIAGGIVDKKFEECFGSATTAGLYDRFIFGQCPRPFTFDFRPFGDDSESVPNPVAVKVHPEVWEQKSEWLRTVPGMNGRIAENALRIASICAGFDGRALLRAENLGPALEFAKYQIRVQTLLQPNPGQNPEAICAFAILQKLEELAPNGEWLNKREVSRAIHADRFGPGIFRRAGDNLVFNEEIERAAIGTNKKSDFWRRLK